MDKINKGRTKTRVPRKRIKSDSSATNRAYLYTKKMILQGSFKGGDLLSEGEVAQELGISRTPVREAFLRLETEGLLRLYPKKGALIVPVSATEVEVVIETRRLIECYALKKLTDQGPNPDLAQKLQLSIDNQETALSEGDAAAFLEADRTYHSCIVESTNNPILIDLYHAMRDRQLRMGITIQAYDVARCKAIIGEHRQIAEEISSGNGSQGMQDINHHLDKTLQILRGRQ